jgi:hypothetical protein
MILALFLTIAQLDKLGQQCFSDMRKFHVIELQQFQSHQPWPTSNQHTDISQRLLTIHTNIYDVLLYGDKPEDEKYQSLLRNDRQHITKLGLDTDITTPKNARKALIKLQKTCDKLYAGEGQR